MDPRARRPFAFIVILALTVSASTLLRAGSPQSVGTWRSIGATPISADGVSWRSERSTCARPSVAG